jgi:hypothetical protein
MADRRQEEQHAVGQAELRDGVRVVGRREGRGEISDVKPHSYSTVQHAPRMAGDHQVFVDRHNPHRNPQPISGAGSARWHVHRIRYRPNRLARTFTRNLRSAPADAAGKND